MVAFVLIPVSDHRTAAVPSPLTDDVHFGGEEGVRGTDDGSDVEVVLPVLDGNVERVTSRVEVSDDRVAPPVAIPVDDVARVTLGQQVGVVAGVVWPRLRVGPDADRSMTRSA